MGLQLVRAFVIALALAIFQIWSANAADADILQQMKGKSAAYTATMTGVVNTYVQTEVIYFANDGNIYIYTNDSDGYKIPKGKTTFKEFEKNRKSGAVVNISTSRNSVTINFTKHVFEGSRFIDNIVISANSCRLTRRILSPTNGPSHLRPHSFRCQVKNGRAKYRFSKTPN